MSSPQFLSDFQYFKLLVERMPPWQRSAYRSLRHARSEGCTRGRAFVVYTHGRHGLQVLDTVTVLHFEADEEAGARCELRSQNTGEILEVGYQPTQLWGYPVFVHLPLHLWLNWDVREGSDTPSLHFGLVVRTASRYTLRERDRVYFETKTSFEKEFGAAQQ
jgi:hypothetical protein